MLFRFICICLALAFTLLSGSTLVLWRLYSAGVFHPATEMKLWHFVPTFIAAALFWAAAVEAEGGEK